MDEDFYVALPKIELHAHLNGSLSEETIKDLLKDNPDVGILPDSTAIEKGAKRTLKDCFDMFKIIQKLTNNTRTITYVTKRVIDEFAKDGVVYLELRSTPRANPLGDLTKRSYVDAVLQGIHEYQKESPEIIDVRYLLSIDRRLGVAEAEDTVKLAKEYMSTSNGLVVGIDLSGDPNVGDGSDYFEILQDAKSAGLKLSLHMAEIRGLDKENMKLLQLPPDRIGHGTFLHEDEACRKLVGDLRIPFEICLTSNVKGGTVESYAEDHHHMHRWKKLGQPYMLCTDDKGVFSTLLSNEYRIAAEYSNMSADDVFTLSRNSIDCIFAGDTMKEMLYKKWNLWMKNNGHYFSCTHSS